MPNSTISARSTAWYKPALTRVCYQIREEALPALYSVNKFHLEMYNSSFKNDPTVDEVLWSPVHWWRAIGDTNLRYIRELSIVGQCMYGPTVSGVMIKYNRSRGSRDIFDINYVLLLSQLGLEAEVQKWKQVQREELLAPMLKALAKDGPYVRVLENIVALLEPRNKRYLPDRELGPGPGHCRVSLCCAVGRAANDDSSVRSLSKSRFMVPSRNEQAAYRHGQKSSEKQPNQYLSSLPCPLAFFSHKPTACQPPHMHGHRLMPLPKPFQILLQPLCLFFVRLHHPPQLLFPS